MLLNGGCLYVPDAEYRDFLALCAECIDDGEPLYVVERPSAQIRFYADFDVHAEADADTDDFIRQISTVFALSVGRCLGIASPVVVLSADTKLIDENTQKIGIHLIVPHSRVSVLEAESLRQDILPDLQQKVSVTPLNGWDEALDKSVYRQGGLRLVRCRKMASCACDTKVCPHMNRKIDAGRPYYFRNVVNTETGELDEAWTQKLRANVMMMTMMASIRLPCGGEVTASMPVVKKRRCVSELPGVSSTLASARSPLLADLVATPPELQHRQLRVVDIVSKTDNCPFRYLLRVQGDQCRYCPHVARMHSTSTVYFVAGPNGISLRCHCKKGGCPAYRGRVLPLSRTGAEFLGMHVSMTGLPPGFL